MMGIFFIFLFFNLDPLVEKKIRRFTSFTGDLVFFYDLEYRKIDVLSAN